MIMNFMVSLLDWTAHCLVERARAKSTARGGENYHARRLLGQVMPFPPQRQEWPGLEGRMQPRPDYGARSYRGSGRLAGRKAIITGGDSGIGRAVALAFAREGADVAIGYLPDEQAD